MDERSDVGEIIHFPFVVGDDFDPFSGIHTSIYAPHDLEGSTLQADALLEAEGSEVLGILVQDLSVENLIAIRIAQSPLRKIPIRTHPMIKAEAVLIYFPSPSGFFGTGVSGKLSSVRRGAVVVVAIVLGLAERKAAVREVFLRPWVEFMRGE